MSRIKRFKEIHDFSNHLINLVIYIIGTLPFCVFLSAVPAHAQCANNGEAECVMTQPALNCPGMVEFKCTAKQTLSVSGLTEAEQNLIAKGGCPGMGNFPSLYRKGLISGRIDGQHAAKVLLNPYNDCVNQAFDRAALAAKEFVLDYECPIIVSDPPFFRLLGEDETCYKIFDIEYLQGGGFDTPPGGGVSCSVKSAGSGGGTMNISQTIQGRIKCVLRKKEG